MNFIIVNRVYVLCLLCLVSVIGFKFREEEEKLPEYLTASVGSYVVFNCELKFPGEHEIPYIMRWNKNGQTILSLYDGTSSAVEAFVGRMNPVNPNVEGYERGAVNLTSVRESDAGWFQCLTVFPNRSPSTRDNGTWFHLSVNGGNLLSIPPINQTTMEGEAARFSCIIKNKNVFVIWYKDGTRITELQDLLHRSYVTEDGTLTIQPTAMGDIGEYECEAQNTEGEKQTAKAYLNVQFKAKVIYAPREVYLPYGRSAVLDCHFRANPPLTNLRWDKDGFLFDPYNVPGVFYRPNGSLYFNKVDETHTGYYTCTPFNLLGTEGPSPAIHVIVQRPPVFTSTPNHVYVKKLGDSLEMFCDASDGEGLHKPTILWTKKDGMPFDEDRFKIEDGNLTIFSIEEEDRGIYQCSAINEAATINTETEIVIENIAPRAPHNLTANSTQHTVHLKWQPGEVGHLMEYSVWYKLKEATEWRTLKILSRWTTEATITNLRPGKEYEFMVLSQENSGDGMFSRTIRVHTKPQHTWFDRDDGETDAFYQISPPKNVSSYANDEGYVITWDPPDYGYENLRVYIVRWWKGPEKFLAGSAETKDTYYLIRHIDEGFTYFFKILALTTNDYEASSEEYVLTIPTQSHSKGLTFGITATVIFGCIAVLAAYFSKKKCSKQDDEEDIEEDAENSKHQKS